MIIPDEGVCEVEVANRLEVLYVHHLYGRCKRASGKSVESQEKTSPEGRFKRAPVTEGGWWSGKGSGRSGKGSGRTRKGSRRTRKGIERSGKGSGRSGKGSGRSGKGSMFITSANGQ